MALDSPGVQISVSDESFYAPAGAGTVPLIVIATAQDKTAPDGSSTADFTTAAEAGKLKLITSQRELLQSYGNPSFKVTGGTPIHGDETNEYGLMAAYSFLGLSNRAYVLRADIDLSDLDAQAIAPAGVPANGTYYVDTVNTVWGLKRFDGANWVSVGSLLKQPTASDLIVSTNLPKLAYGVDGDIAVNYVNQDGTTPTVINFYEKVAGTWYQIGTSAWTAALGNSEFFVYATHTTIPTGVTAGDMFLQTTAPNNGTTLVVNKYNATTGQFVTETPYLSDEANLAYSFYETAGTLAAGVVWGEQLTVPDAGISPKSWNGLATLTVASTAAIVDGALTGVANVAATVMTIFANNSSTGITVLNDANSSTDDVVASIQTALSAANVTTTFADQITASNVAGVLTIVNSEGYDITLADGTANTLLADLNLTAGIFSNFANLTYTASATAVTGATIDGKLWYDADISTTNLDILEHNGTTWVDLTTDLQTKATTPTLQSDGVSALVTGDVWVNSSDTENITLYKYDTVLVAWVLVDNTDQSSPDGILFADFRQVAGGSLDADAPDATLYPSGMLAWNYRASGGNVKQWNLNYTPAATNIGNVWVSYSGNKVDGSPNLLRKAQRRASVVAMQAAVVSNTDIRNETNRFNIAAVPGYPELADEMLALGTDRKDTVFSLIDTPLRLASDATSIQAWATNSNNAVENGEDGLLSASSEAATYYPSGLTTNLDGTNAMVPASHMVLRTYAYNDQVSFPWFAPAGFQRGLVNNVTSVGYLDTTESEYTPVSLNEGQRDTLYLNKVNPIATFPGRGITVFGQKTLNPVSSALDRVNVSRLVIYLREQLDDAVKPFLFQPNDEITRANAKVVVDRLLGELVSQRGLYDYVVVVDGSNNTPARIDRNELHIDIAIQPVKAIEFIFIPIRIQNTLGVSG